MNNLPAHPRVCVDWFRVIADLGRHGMSYRAMADAIGVSKSTVMGWVSGAEPRFSDGELLLALWGEKLGRATADAPRLQLSDWRANHLSRTWTR